MHGQWQCKHKQSILMAV